MFEATLKKHNTVTLHRKLRLIKGTEIEYKEMDKQEREGGKSCSYTKNGPSNQAWY